MGRLASVELCDPKLFGPVTVVDNVSLRIDARATGLPSGPLRLRQDDDAAAYRGFPRTDIGRDHVGDRLIVGGRTLPPEQAQDVDDLPKLRAVPDMTVAENITYGLKLRKLDRDTIAKKPKAILQATSSKSSQNAIRADRGRHNSALRWRGRWSSSLNAVVRRALIHTRRQPARSTRFEIHRPHDEYRYTTVYVTHDQSEAMNTADLIVVMKGGKTTSSARRKTI